MGKEKVITELSKEQVIRHITEHERYVISALLKEGYRPNEISLRLCKHKRTIEREIKQGRVIQRDTYWQDRLVYSPAYANTISISNQSHRGRKCKCLAPDTCKVIDNLLLDNYSSDAVMGANF